MIGRIVTLASSLLLGACSVVGIRGGTETPRYEVVAQVGEAEIRSYAPRLAAETVVQGEEQAARSAGFRRLAAYIFGKNRAKDSISMTAPVAQSAASASGAGTIAMTAPVAAERAGPDAWTVRFFMPSDYTSETLPKPDDPEVRIVTVPGETMAVYRFSGSRTASAMARGREVLLGQLRASAWQAAGEPVDWFYDPPWTLAPFRRNEVAVPVKPAG